MSEGKVTINQGEVKNLLAWGSIAYAFGFVTVMLHTARLGFPVLELLSSIYIWVGAPLALIGFLSLRFWTVIKSQAIKITCEIRDSWKDLKQGVGEEDFDVISEFVAFTCFFSLTVKLLRQPFEALLRKAMASKPEVSDRAKQILSRTASVIRGLQAINRFLRLVYIVLFIVLMIFLYVWVIYPNIPQSYGGGAPTTVRLLINTNKIPHDLSGLLGIDTETARKVMAETSLTDPIQLLYTTADQYYIKGTDGKRVSLRKDLVEGLIWNPEK